MGPRPEILLLAGSALFVSATAGLLWWDALRTHPPGQLPSLRLHAVEQDGRIRVDWDPADPLVRRARSATLVARDGQLSHEYPVSPEGLRSGGLDYLRRTNDVLLTLRVDGGSDTALRTIVAAPPVPAPAVPAPKEENRARRR